jgi:uncharacterized protein (TIGR03084 family)
MGRLKFQDGTMTTHTTDLREEQASLHRLFAAHPAADYLRETPFHHWRAVDVLAHLWFTDSLALLALDDPPACDAAVAAFGSASAGLTGTPLFAAMSAHQHDCFRREFGGPEPGTLLQRWRERGAALCAAFDRHAPDENVQWFGRAMKAARLRDARQMEVWAYGQDVFDLFRSERHDTDRLLNIADFAVRTFRFAFANRGLAIPERAPFVVLHSPSGRIHAWHDTSENDRIEGSMTEFCLVATQRRHPEDTGLLVRGDTAATWMRIAQCIAGPPLDGPRPGERDWRN